LLPLTGDMSLRVVGFVSVASALEPLGPVITIAPGVEMTTVNLGTCCGSDPKLGLEPWLKAGGHGIDTAWDYSVQEDIGQILKELAVPRDSIFITSKLPAGFGNATDCEADASIAVRYAEENVRQLGIEYLDLLLIHAPCKNASASAALWEGMQQVQAMGLSRAIGVSNFNTDQLDQLPGPLPSLNQCHMGVTDHDDEAIAYHRQKGIQYEAWSPLRGCPFDDATVAAVAAEHNVSVAQVCLRYILEKGVAVAVGTGNKPEKVDQYTTENLDIYSFSLTVDEFEAVDALQPEGGYPGNPCRKPQETSVAV